MGEENLSLNNSERRISFSELSRWANSSAGSFSSHGDRVIYEDDASVLSTVSISIYDAADFEPSRPQRLPSLEQDGIEMLAKSLIDNESLSQTLEYRGCKRRVLLDQNTNAKILFEVYIIV